MRSMSRLVSWNRFIRPRAIAGEIEPLLPIEKKLIGWSFGLGIVLLVILIGFNHFVPIKL